MNKIVEKIGKYLAGLGALNWGTSELISINGLTYIPDGIFRTLAVVAIAASGILVVYLTFKKKI